MKIKVSVMLTGIAEVDEIDSDTFERGADWMLCIIDEATVGELEYDSISREVRNVEIIETRQRSQQKSSVGRETKHSHPITGDEI